MIYEGGKSTMIACYAWTNNQIFNIANAKASYYADDKADLYVYLGNSLSRELLDAVRDSGLFNRIYCFDPVNMDTKKGRFGNIKALRGLFIQSDYQKAYGQLLDHISVDYTYDRILVGYLYAHSVFFIDYWTRKAGKRIPVTLVDEGTASHYFTKKQFINAMFMIRKRKARMRQYLSEYRLARKAGKGIDTLCIYNAENNQTEVPYKKLVLPPVRDGVLKDILMNAFTEDSNLLHPKKKDNKKIVEPEQEQEQETEQETDTQEDTMKALLMLLAAQMSGDSVAIEEARKLLKHEGPEAAEEITSEAEEEAASGTENDRDESSGTSAEETEGAGKPDVPEDEAEQKDDTEKTDENEEEAEEEEEPTRLDLYENASVIYFSSYSADGKPYDLKSIQILRRLIYCAGAENVLAKIHPHASLHAKSFARSLEKFIFCDRSKYYFEGLYAHLQNKSNKIFVSAISSTMMNMKFIFEEEPYLVFTYRLYDTYRQCGNKTDDQLAEEIRSSYSDPSRVLIPNSIFELEEMMNQILPYVLPEEEEPEEEEA